MFGYDYEDLPDDADELKAEDRRRRRVCHHRDGDPDCECHDMDPDESEDSEDSEDSEP